MEIGKIQANELEEKILDKIKYHHRDVLLHAGIGEDSAVVDFGEEVLVISSDPITGATDNAGYIAVHITCNDLAAAGAKPVGLQVVLLLPDSIKDNQISNLMQEIHDTAAEIDVEILGGHTEIVSTVSQPIIVTTGIGKAKKESYLPTGGARVGDDLVVTKGLGIEGIYILANDYQKYLLAQGISFDLIKSAQQFGSKLSVLPEGEIAVETGAHALHDITEGGLYGALEEMSKASNKGFEISLETLELSPEIKVITEVLGLDPAGLLSSGSMLIATPKGEKLVKKLDNNGIKAWQIGNVRDKEKYIGDSKGNLYDFNWSGEDELWKWMNIMEETSS